MSPELEERFSKTTKENEMRGIELFQEQNPKQNRSSKVQRVEGKKRRSRRCCAQLCDGERKGKKKKEREEERREESKKKKR